MHGATIKIQRTCCLYTDLLFSVNSMIHAYTVKPVLNGISRDQNIFPLKPGFHLIKVHCI